MKPQGGGPWPQDPGGPPYGAAPQQYYGAPSAPPAPNGAFAPAGATLYAYHDGTLVPAPGAGGGFGDPSAPLLAPAGAGGGGSAPRGGVGYYSSAPGLGFGFGSSAGGPLATADHGMGTDLMYASRAMRHGFLRKVLGIVCAQLLLTAAIAAPILLLPGPQKFLFANRWAVPLAVIVTFGTLISLVCSEGARRSFPSNLLLLGAFTAAQGVLVGVACAAYDTPTVLMAVVMTAAVCLSLVRRTLGGGFSWWLQARALNANAETARPPPNPRPTNRLTRLYPPLPLPQKIKVLYALQTKYDFTAAGGMLYSAVSILLLIMLASWVLRIHTLDLLIAGCGALLFCSYLVYDVQVGGWVGGWVGVLKLFQTANRPGFGVCCAGGVGRSVSIRHPLSPLQQCPFQPPPLAPPTTPIATHPRSSRHSS
jgi:FtsH-binding integral membrane protein